MDFLNTIGYGAGAPHFSAGLGVLVIVLALWSVVWKGFALWRSAKRGEKLWFVVFLVVNTAGILELIYLFVISGAKLSDLLPEKK